MTDHARKASAASSDWSDESQLQPQAQSRQLRLITAKKLVRMKHAHSRRHWGRKIKDGMLGMVYGKRGAGKTYVVLGLAISMACRVSFLGSKPDRPRKVVLLDGEMGSRALKGRVKEMQKSLGAKSLKNLLILTPDLSKQMLPSLASRKGQREIDELIPHDTDVIIVDNVSCWNHDGREDADGWSVWAEWLLRHKHLGRTVIIVHHAGKNGAQRGTSRREDLLDFVIALQPMEDPHNKDALAFRLVWEKSRGLGKKDTPPLVVTRVESRGAAPEWKFEAAVGVDELTERAIALRDEGKSLEEIGKELGRHKSSISRMLKDAGK